MDFSTIAKMLAQLATIVSLLGDFIVRANLKGIRDTNLASRLKICQDQLDLLQDSLTLSKGDENETPDDTQRLDLEDSTG